MLAMLDTTGYEKTGAGSAQTYHYLAEVMRRFYADRNEYVGDPEFVKNPISSLLNPDYVRARRATINPEHATPGDQLGPGLALRNDDRDTTHYSIVDETRKRVSSDLYAKQRLWEWCNRTRRRILVKQRDG
jgi:gamma-glutamyltranspeptidase / glutathione hydrolase